MLVSLYGDIVQFDDIQPAVPERTFSRKGFQVKDTVCAIRKAKAINAMRKMQEISVSLGNDTMSLDKINAVIKETRTKKKR